MRSVNWKRLNTMAPLALQGNPDAYAALLEEGYPLAWFIIHRRGYYHPDRAADIDDLMQEAMTGYVRGIPAWNPAKITKFYSWAMLCIERAIHTELKTATRVKRLVNVNAASIDAPIDDEGTERITVWRLGSEDPADLAAGSEAVELLEELFADLNPLQRQAVEICLLGNIAMKAAAAIMQIEYKTLDNVIYRARRRMDKTLARLVGDSRFTPETRTLLARALTGEHRRQVYKDRLQTA